MRQTHIKLCSMGVIFFLGAIVYSNTLFNSFHFDDAPCIVNNLTIRNIGNFYKIWEFWPTRFINYYSIALNYYWGGLNVFGYHLVNVLLHIGAAVGVWLLLVLSFRTPLMRAEKISDHAYLLSLFAALIFLVHPVQTQPVNYLMQRAVILAALFYLFSLGLYVRFRLAYEENSRSRRWVVFAIAAFISGFISMFSKETAISLPVVMCLYEFHFFKDTRANHWKFLWPFLILIMVVPLTWQATHNIPLAQIPDSIDGYAGGVGVAQYAATQIRVLVTYIRLLFIPVSLTLDYDYRISQGFLEFPVVGSFLLLVLVLMVAVKHKNRGPLAFFGVFWFFITLFPESSFWPNKDVIFEHRLYLPMLGFCCMLVAGLYGLLKDRPRWMMPVVVVVIAVYALLAFQRNAVWKNELTLWGDGVHKAPRKARPYLNRGAAYQNNGSHDLAIADYTRAIELEPGDVIVHSNRGLAYQNIGDMEKALADYSRAISLSPNYVGTFVNRGRAYEKMGKLDKALDDFNTALKFKPDYSGAYINRGLVYVSLGQFNLAIADFTKAAALDPKSAGAYNNRGQVYQKMGRFNEALQDYHKAISLMPQVAGYYNNLGLVYGQMGDQTKALEQFNKAMDIDPKYAGAYYNRAGVFLNKGDLTGALSDYDQAIACDAAYVGNYINRGLLYARMGKFDKSVEDFTQAIKLDPDYAVAYNNRGMAYVYMGKTKEAIDDFKAALQIDPNYKTALSNLQAMLSKR